MKRPTKFMLSLSCRWRHFLAGGLLPFCGLVLASCHSGPTQSRLIAAADTLVTIDATAPGLVFDGAGAISASSSRLLYDYPEPERSQILDYLFLPNYGGAMQILKVEIGSDMNSTTGAEPSHMQAADDPGTERGFEWWLMREAKKRNPDIRLYALAWGTPGWVGGFWTDANIGYLIRWLDMAEERGFVIDYIGGWNERGFDADWYVKFSKAVKAKYPNVQIVGADDVFDPWGIAHAMVDNEALRDAIDIVGVHSACGWRNRYQHCTSPEDARGLGKPLWNSEHSSLSHDTGAEAMARAMNRLYIQARISGNLCWSLISAWYATYPIADTGLALAEWPWSGYYRIGKSIWAYAHTTQFTQPGWQYLDPACGFLPGGASYVSLRSPDGVRFSTIVETLDADTVCIAAFALKGGLQSDEVYVWSTDLRSDDPADHFILTQTIRPDSGRFAVELEPGRVYTLTNTTGQHKGNAQPQATVHDVMPLPYAEDFDGYETGRLARYFFDLNGGFETAPAKGGRNGMSYRQTVTKNPVAWTRFAVTPATLMGDPRWWGDYEVGADALLEEPGYVELLGRVATHGRSTQAGYHLRVDDRGNWMLYRQDFAVFGKWITPLDSGRVDMGINQWHRLGLRMTGDSIVALYDGKPVGTVMDDYYTSGQIGLAVSPWHHAQFDNVTVGKTREWPQLIPQQEMSVVDATSQMNNFYKGYTFKADYAIDGRPETAWYTDWEPKLGLPQSITVDLGRKREVSGIICQPRYDSWNIIGETLGHITRCNVYLSEDGEAYELAGTANWTPGSAVRKLEWQGPRKARFVRIEAAEGTNDAASIGELQIIGQ